VLASTPLRFVTDDVDRDHPLVIDRSMKAEVGGAIILRSGERKAQMIRVSGREARRWDRSVGCVQRCAHSSFE